MTRIVRLPVIGAAVGALAITSAALTEIFSTFNPASRKTIHCTPGKVTFRAQRS